MTRTALILFLLLICLHLFAQDEIKTEKQKDLPVSESFAGGILIDNQTSFIPVKNTFEFVIQHKFGSIDNGFSDLFGLYAAGSFIRLGGNYVLAKNLQIGYGLSRLRMYNDFSIKYNLFEQTRKNRIPVTITLFANTAIDGRNKENFGKHYHFTSRLSYFSQLIIGRKFNDFVSIQLNGSFAHYNMTDPGIDHDKITVGINGKVSVNYKSAIIFQYDLPLKVDDIKEHREFLDPAQPNLGIGWEVRTSAHVFHIYLSTSESMVPQHNTLFNQNRWLKGQVMFGFSITRFYNFI